MMYEMVRVISGVLATTWAALFISGGVTLLVLTERGATGLGMALLAIIYYQSHVKMLVLSQLTTLSHALVEAQVKGITGGFTDEDYK